jgi:organic radical activating enzyme
MVKPGGYRMEWVTKGHEFDILGAVFQKNNKLFIVGTAEDNEVLCKKLDFLDIAIETSPLLKGRKSKLSKLFYLLLNLLASPPSGKISRIAVGRNGSEFDKDGKTVIINHPNRFYAEYILRQFIMTGEYRKNENIFLANDFLGDYLSIFAVYVCNKLYSKHNALIVTTVCNLNCKYCLNFTPFLKKKEHIDISQLKKAAGIYFSYIDKIGWFHLSGGEPLLYPWFSEIIQYISNNYGSKIDELSFSTNGTVVPSDELCDVFKKYNVKVLVDDYTKAVPKVKSTCMALIKKLREHEIPILLDSKGSFYKQFPPAKASTQLDESGLAEKYDRCQYMYHGQPLKNGRVCNCLYTSFAETAGLIEASSDDYYDLNVFPNTELARKEFMEFRLGYSNRGYSSLCRYCNGSGNINPYKSLAGEQAKGKLNWDVNNPTYLEDSYKIGNREI